MGRRRAARSEPMDGRPDFDALQASLVDLPATWYPDLLRTLITAAYDAGVFRLGGATAYVRAMEEEVLFAHRRQATHSGDENRDDC